MKQEWKKVEKQFYLPKEKPELVTIPSFQFLMINGEGNPNNPDFGKRVEVLYQLSYTIKMMPRKGYTPDGYFDYQVYPLEGLWDLTEEGKKSTTLNKDELLYTIMIRQPCFVTPDVFNKAIELVKKKNDSPLFNAVRLENMEEGLVVQMLHIGSYDSESKTFEQMKKFINDNNLVIKTLRHREIYLSDARKADPTKLKTVLRYLVSKK